MRSCWGAERNCRGGLLTSHNTVTQRALGSSFLNVRYSSEDPEHSHPHRNLKTRPNLILRVAAHWTEFRSGLLATDLKNGEGAWPFLGLLQVINVAFCIDAAFWQPLGVTLSSLLKTNPQEQFRVFIISNTAPTPKVWDTLNTVVSATENATLYSLVFGDAALYAHLPAKGHLSTAVYLRLFLAQLLPEDVDRVLYLDSDVLVLSRSIRELWEIPLGDAYLGAAFEPYDARQRTPIGFGPKDFYFNSGVMLIQLGKWRRDLFMKELLTFAEANTAHLYSSDQDVLNCVLRGQVVDIGVKWNWQALFPRMLPEELRIDPQTYEELKRAPGIVHFTSAYKPWYWRWEPHYKHLYRRAQLLTPWARTRPVDQTLANLPVKLSKVLQRNVEWRLPILARRLRGTR